MWILRKAYVGFASVKETEISTSHWGSGIFLNNKNVIFCLQALAATLARKQLAFYAFGMQDASSIKGYELVRKWREDGTTVERAFEELLKLCDTGRDFGTVSPHLAINKFTVEPDKMPLNPDFTRTIVRVVRNKTGGRGIRRSRTAPAKGLSKGSGSAKGGGKGKGTKGSKGSK